MIDAWILRYLRDLKLIDTNLLKDKTRLIVSHINTVRNSPIMNKVESENYFGTYESYNTYKKRVMKNNLTNSYYPYQTQKLNKE